MTRTVLDGRYELGQGLGRGGFGQVHEARNLLTGRRVAIKVMAVAPSASPDESRARFVLEARAAAALEHQNVVQVLDFGFADSELFLVMERLDGESLAGRLEREGRLVPAEVCSLLVPILNALGYAHEQGIVHRDLKPENIVLAEIKGAPTVVPKLVDFGVAQWRSEGFDLTRTGEVIGTPHYLAPEQAIESRSVDHRADIYSIGVIIYEALSGELPFPQEKITDLMLALATEDPPPIHAHDPTLPAPFGELLERCLAKDPNRRFASVAELRAALESAI
ncbi:MAG: serine/threonine-protein kinase [Myxococcota bacterium]